MDLYQQLKQGSAVMPVPEGAFTAAMRQLRAFFAADRGEKMGVRYAGSDSSHGRGWLYLPDREVNTAWDDSSCAASSSCEQ
jgi:hypothetical protein